ncbi:MULTISPECIES: YtxH domain-containing protein [Sphingobacteriaceae]|uniref:YtxH domain-containing protein n=1 Tax=Sphingobacteriaceae TaxID=84566 RepID=UPI000DE4BF2F|nr:MULTISPECIES: YtxH domain-containing protein [Sphingobacteriaceae]
MSDNSKVVVALLAGLAAGAALGILFAPDKGSDTRDKLGQSLKDFGDSIKERAADEINNLSSLKDKVVNSIKGKLRDVEQEYSDEVEHV